MLSLQVMLLRNVDPARGLVNGSRGVVIRFTDPDSDEADGGAAEDDRRSATAAAVRPLFDRVNERKQWPVVRFLSVGGGASNSASSSSSGGGGLELPVYPELFETEQSGKVIASRLQVPLALAWALTVHKCQGMTLDAAKMSLRSVFECGQGYVAVSRLRDLSSLCIDDDPNVELPWARIFRAHPRALAFYKSLQSTSAEAVGDDAEVDAGVATEMARPRSEGLAKLEMFSKFERDKVEVASGATHSPAPLPGSSDAARAAFRMPRPTAAASTAADNATSFSVAPSGRGDLLTVRPRSDTAGVASAATVPSRLKAASSRGKAGSTSTIASMFAAAVAKRAPAPLLAPAAPVRAPVAQSRPHDTEIDLTGDDSDNDTRRSSSSSSSSSSSTAVIPAFQYPDSESPAAASTSAKASIREEVDLFSDSTPVSSPQRGRGNMLDVASLGKRRAAGSAERNQ
jgi:hypothetical protein